MSFFESLAKLELLYWKDFIKLRPFAFILNSIRFFCKPIGLAYPKNCKVLFLVVNWINFWSKLTSLSISWLALPFQALHLDLKRNWGAEIACAYLLRYDWLYIRMAIHNLTLPLLRVRIKPWWENRLLISITILRFILPVQLSLRFHWPNSNLNWVLLWLLTLSLKIQTFSSAFRMMTLVSTLVNPAQYFSEEILLLFLAELLLIGGRLTAAA